MRAANQVLQGQYSGILDRTNSIEAIQTTKTKIYQYYIYFIIYSFVGWVWETAFTSINEGSFQKRGFLNVPILPIYGCAITFIVFMLYKKGYSVVRIFFESSIITSISEFITSWTMEQMFHKVWWDYSQMRFQIQGRVCLSGAILFGVASVIVVKVAHPYVERLAVRFLENKNSRKICIASVCVIVLDTICTSLLLLR